MRAAQLMVRDAVRAGLLTSAHDIAEGGVAVALAECCLAGLVGAEVELDGSIEALFGEGPGGFLVSAPPGSLDALAGAAPLRRIGSVGGEMLRIGAGEHSLVVTLGELGGGSRGARGAVRVTAASL